MYPIKTIQLYKTIKVQFLQQLLSLVHFYGFSLIGKIIIINYMTLYLKNYINPPNKNVFILPVTNFLNI